MSKKSGKMSKQINYNGQQSRKNLSKLFSASLFIGCLIFVLIRGYKCSMKYLNKPEGLDMSFEFSGALPFPSITFCPLGGTGVHPKTYDTKVLKVG